MRVTPIHNGQLHPKKKRAPDHTPDDKQENKQGPDPDGPLSGRVKEIIKRRANGESEAEAHAALGMPELASDDTPQPRRKARQEAAPAEEPALAFQTLKDLFNTPDEQTEWLVDEILPVGGLSLLVAKPKVGKSTLARNLALAVAQGRDFLGKHVMQGLVIYLALEEKRSEVKRHFRDLGATGDEPILLFSDRVPAHAFQQVCLIAAQRRPALIIVDPLFYLARINDGNDYAEVSRALAPFLTLARETGAHVLCVHHAGKIEREGGDSIIGSTALFAAVDTALILKRTDRYRTISSRQRYGVDLPEMVLDFDPQTRTVALGVSKEQNEEARVAEAILECLALQESTEQGRTLTQPELDEAVEGRTLYKRKALKALLDSGKIERTGKGGKGDPFRYSLKNPCFLVPNIYREQENNKEKESR
jgi:hypothetical protein